MATCHCQLGNEDLQGIKQLLAPQSNYSKAELLLLQVEETHAEWSCMPTSESGFYFPQWQKSVLNSEDNYRTTQRYKKSQVQIKIWNMKNFDLKNTNEIDPKMMNNFIWLQAEDKVPAICERMK